MFNRYNVWVDKNGDVHKIAEMSEQHIYNCMSMIIRTYMTDGESFGPIFNKRFKVKHGKKYLKKFTKELYKRDKQRI